MASQGGVRIGVVRAGPATAAAMAARSRTALDQRLEHPAELWIATASDEAVLLGAFQRAGGAAAEPTFRRGSGGPAVHVGPGTVHVALSLARPDALEPCDASRIVNRAVRPLLRALTKTAKLAHYFGRDWVSVAHRPAAWVGFAHDATTGRTLFEAFVAVSTPFARGGRASFLGKVPGTLEELAKRAVDAGLVADTVAAAYLAAHGATEVALPAVAVDVPAADRVAADPPWDATIDEAIGEIGAGPDARGVFRVGGDLLVSRDALASLESRAAASTDEGMDRVVEESLGRADVAIEGVASLASVRDVILRARRGARRDRG